MLYQLWDVETGNLLCEFGSEGDALTAVRDALKLHGHDYAVALGLTYLDPEGRPHTVADGDALIERALRSASSAA